MSLIPYYLQYLSEICEGTRESPAGIALTEQEDLKKAMQLQTEIARIHRECGITIMFVTHDIGEALRLGTRVLVLDAGKIQQYGTPQEILARPATEFVERLVARQRHACDLSDERLCACEHSGAARAKAALLAQGE